MIYDFDTMTEEESSLRLEVVAETLLIYKRRGVATWPKICDFLIKAINAREWSTT